MNGIQVLLISGVIVIGFYYALRLRSALFDLLILTLCCGLAIFFILAPSYTNIIAHRLGVGRGADLLFYICILLFLFIILKLFARVRRLEKTLTEFVRKQAKEDAFLIDQDSKVFTQPK
jgi:small membrane protein